MIRFPNHRAAPLLDLGMTFQTEIRVALNQQLRVERTMRLMARRTPLAHRFVLEHERTSLLAVTWRAALVQPGHRQTAGRLANVVAMRVMAIATTQAALEDRMMPRQVELRVGRQMTLETRGRFASRIDDQLAVARRRHMTAPRTVTRLAPGLPGHLEVVLTIKPAVGAAGKSPGVIGMAVGAGRIAHKRRAFNGGRGVQRAVEGPAGGQPQHQG